MVKRIDKQGLMTELGGWNSFLKKKVYLIACGGTAMTMIGVKDSTKDIDFMVPNEAEYNYLLKIIKDLGYKPVSGHGWARDGGFTFDLFRGNKIFTTELLESPLEEGNNIKLSEFSHIYLGILNYYDLIISKLFRGSSVDFEDCSALVKAKRKEIDIDRLTERFQETASYEVSHGRVQGNFEHFLRLVKKP